ncbi:transketolase [Rugosimonospora acidiphila]|uniref:Transketolase n=1 Tax=Rugosimonospora acidiphila TaxID=556531 RepID=A0ABP9RZK8_9ACTN
MREELVNTATALLDEDPRVAVVLADISSDLFDGAARRHPDRVINVGIREQLLLGVTGGLAKTGLRPIAHTYAPFLVERAFEQIKLDLDHQGGGAVLVSVGASYDAARSGRTHQAPGDVALIDTLSDWTVHVPGHPDEVGPLLREAVGRDGSSYLRLSTESNAAPHDGYGLVPIRHGRAATVVAVGPMLDPVLAAAEGLDVTVAYTHTPRPFDRAGLRALVSGTDAATVVLVEPYLAGTSASQVADALVAVPHRLLSLGVGRTDPRRYGTPADHARLHGLTPDQLRRAIGELLPA